MLKIFGLFITCVLLSACGGGGSTSVPGAGNGGSGTTAWESQLNCDSGCTTTQSGFQIQVQPNTTIGTGATAGCSLNATFSNSNTDVGLPTLANAIVFVSLTAPTCSGSTWTTTITFASASGGTTNWSNAKAYILSSGSWSSTTSTPTASNLTLSTTTTVGTETSFAITD